jgi:hypothetical protein
LETVLEDIRQHIIERSQYNKFKENKGLHRAQQDITMQHFNKGKLNKLVYTKNKCGHSIFLETKLLET